MRYNLEKKPSRFAIRTLKTFSDTMFSLLETKSFETIMVSEICQLANYLRATFYNYFEDKYDLLEYCWSIIKDKIYPQDFVEMNSENRVYEIFGRIYDFFDEKKDRLFRILSHNPLEGELYLCFKQYMGSQILDIMNTIHFSSDRFLPEGLLAEYYCATMLLVLEYSFLKEMKFTKTQAIAYLQTLLKKG